VLDKPPAPIAASGNLRWWALGALALAVLAVGVDGTVLSVALPTLSKALHASESDLQWFSSGYFLVLAAAMLPAGFLGDRYGRKKVLLVSLALFGVGSAGCAYSTSVGEFMAARVLVGLAGAGLIVMAFSVLTVLFAKGERPKAVGVMAVATFVAFPIGPILGGWLLTSYWWGWVFLINVPVVVVALVAVLALLPESRASKHPALDLVGVVASAAGLVILTYGLIEAGQDGWGSVDALAMMVGGVALLVGFFAWERRLTRSPGGQPLIDVTLFTSASFTWGVIISMFPIVAMLGVLFTMPQYFQGVLGTTAMGSGLRLLPLVAGLVVGAVPAAPVVRLVGAKVAVAAGFVLLMVGLLLGSTMTLGSSGLFVAGWMALAGLGVGIAHGHHHVRRPGRTVRGEERCRLGGHAGRQQDRGSARHRHPRQRPQRRLSGPARLGGPAGGRGGRCPPKRLWRRGGRRQAPLARTAYGGAASLRPRDGPGPSGLSWHRPGRRCPHRSLPAADECLAEATDAPSGRRRRRIRQSGDHSPGCLRLMAATSLAQGNWLGRFIHETPGSSRMTAPRSIAPYGLDAFSAIGAR
jgi:MFS transporter, DHA2 family, multidrug resistance protein